MGKYTNVLDRRLTIKTVVPPDFAMLITNPAAVPRYYRRPWFLTVGDYPYLSAEYPPGGPDREPDFSRFRPGKEIELSYWSGELIYNDPLMGDRPTSYMRAHLGNVGLCMATCTSTKMVISCVRGQRAPDERMARMLFGESAGRGFEQKFVGSYVKQHRIGVTMPFPKRVIADRALNLEPSYLKNRLEARGVEVVPGDARSVGFNSVLDAVSTGVAWQLAVIPPNEEWHETFGETEYYSVDEGSYEDALSVQIDNYNNETRVDLDGLSPYQAWSGS